MAGFNLLNLGTALGGFTQGYQQNRDAQIQNALRQIALSQALSQQRSQALAGRGLAAGLLDQLQTNAPQMLPAGPAAGGAPTPVATPPMPGAPPVPATPPATLPQVPNAAAGLSSDDQPDAVPPVSMMGVSAPSGGQYGWNPQPPSPVSGGLSADTESLRAPLEPTPRAAPAAPPQTASAGGSDAQPEAPAAPTTHVDATLPNGQSLGIPDMFKMVDPGKIAQGLARIAPPGTDPADIYAATADLLKLANGNKTEQWQAALLAKEMGWRFHAADTDKRIAAASDLETQRQTGRTQLQTQRDTAAGGRQTERETFQAGQQEKRQTFQAGQQQQRFSEAEKRRAEAKATGLQKSQMAAVETQIRNGNSRVAQLQAMPQTSATKQAIATAQAQVDTLQKNYDAMVGKLLAQ